MEGCSAISSIHQSKYLLLQSIEPLPGVVSQLWPYTNWKESTKWVQQCADSFLLPNNSYWYSTCSALRLITTITDQIFHQQFIAHSSYGYQSASSNYSTTNSACSFHWLILWASSWTANYTMDMQAIATPKLFKLTTHTIPYMYLNFMYMEDMKHKPEI